MKFLTSVFLAAVLLLGARSAHADDFVTIPNAASLKWFQVNGTGQIFLRNLNDYDPTFLGCCWNYYIDINGAPGRTLWASVLLKMAAGQSIILAVGSKTTAGPIIYGGTW